MAFGPPSTSRDKVRDCTLAPQLVRYSRVDNPLIDCCNKNPSFRKSTEYSDWSSREAQHLCFLKMA